MVLRKYYWLPFAIMLFFFFLVAMKAGLVSPFSVNMDKSGAPYSLLGIWKFKPGDDQGWAASDFDDSDWSTQLVPESWAKPGFPEHGQVAWYRLNVNLKSAELNQVDLLGIRVAAVRSAYEIYVGGKLLGGVGRLPPDAEINWDKIAIYPIDPELITAEQNLQIALRVWGGTDLGVRKSGGGIYMGKFQIGDFRTLVQSLDAEQIPKLVSAALFIAMGLYFLYLYHRNREIASFFWFSICSTLMGPYILTQSQWKYNFDLPFVFLEKIESVSVYLFAIFLLELIWVIVRQPVPIPIRIMQVCVGTFALLVAIIPGLEIHHHLRLFWQLSIILGAIATMWLVVSQSLAKNKEAQTLLVGMIIFNCCAINDVLINMQLIQSIRIMPLGFLALLVSMGISLANRLSNMVVLLEQQVLERTQELSDTNLRLSAANQQLEDLAGKDALTGLLNRRGFVEAAKLEIERFERSKRNFVIILSDIDFFKRFNDEYGHACGDFVLTKIAEVFSTQLRGVDRVSRWGGEEFVFLLPETGIDGGKEIAEKLRRSIADTRFSYEDMDLKVTMTFGVSAFKRGESLDASIARADDLLYVGKEQGRNRVAVDS